MSTRKLDSKFSSLEDPALQHVNLPELGGTKLSEDLSKFEIADRLRTAALSPLDLQAKLMTDVFLTDEDRAEFMRITGTGMAPATGPALAPLTEPQLHPALSPGPEQLNLAQAYVPLPPRGPFGDTFEVAAGLAPELAPQGLLSHYGMTGPQGLLAPRRVGGSGESHQENSPTRGTALFDGLLVSNDEAQKHFQPGHLTLGIPSPWEKHGPSPFIDLLKRLFRLVASLLGFGPPGGYRGGRPELGQD